MGAASSRIEEDKALQLCRERKKFVRQALDGRCTLAAAHFTYIESLRNTGTVLRKFVEPEAPVESSLYTSTNATPEPLSLIEKSISHFSEKNFSRQVDHGDATEKFSPSSSPPNSSHIQANHMKFRSTSSMKVEEKPPLPVLGIVTSSSTPKNTTPSSMGRPDSSPFDTPLTPTETPPWDYFGLFHPIDRQFSAREEKGMNQGIENADNDIRRLGEEEVISELEDEKRASFHGREESQDSEDDFDEDSTDNLVRSFENLNRIHDAASTSPNVPSAGSVASENDFLNWEKNDSPALAPLRAPPSAVAPPTNTKKTPMKEDCIESKVAGKDFFSSIKDIEYLFIKASDSGKEVPRMLEANKLHFRPIFEGKESGSAVSTFVKACFSCGEEPTQFQEEPDQDAMKYLTWHRTASSHSSSSRHPLGSNSKDDIDDLTSNLFDNFCMNSGSHASTLDRLYAWERKLYDEVKASEIVRSEYDLKCKSLRQLESNGESTQKIDKTRAIVKDLHSRIRVAIHRIESISKKIEELRDKELQPQLEELIEGLNRMWEVMFECHKLQFQIITEAYNDRNTKFYIESESHRQIAIHLESELGLLSSSFTKWIGAQESYLKAINGWLIKCVLLPQNFYRRKRRQQPPPLRDYGPPIYFTCDEWLKNLQKLPSKEVSDSIRGLAAEISHFLPRQERNQGKTANISISRSRKANNDNESAFNLLRDEVSEETFDRFRSSLVGFIGQLNNFAESSVKMYVELKRGIEKAKSHYEQLKTQL